ncbi:MAG TPA: RHS repeat-associated core domain-containing protein [Rhodanobacteraceae bacterium]|nr:RHS repeat-associated core domain-containing protein [Rhodanobacteraceae bacterium]
MVAYLMTGAAYAQQSNTKTTVTYFLTDAQGNVLATTDAQGNITARYTYRPYGTQQSGPTNAGPGYTGHVNDPNTGLVYMQQRYYDPDIGRFISPDPIGPAAGNVFNFNRYAYANNNPIKFTDPDGRCPDTDFGCGSLFKAHVEWRLSHPNAPPDGLEKVAFGGVGVMAAPTVGSAAVTLLRTPLTYLAFSLGTKDLDVVEAMKAAAARQRAAEIVEAAKEATKTIEKRIEELLKEAEKKKLPPPPPPKLPEPPPPKPSTVIPVVHPEAHSNNGEVILRDQF